MIPEHITSLATPGEQQLFYYLKETLPNNFIVWYELDAENRYPDFVIIGPQTGLIILEIKDWSAEKIQSFDQSDFYLKLNGKTQSFKNPKKQGKTFKDIIGNKLKNALNSESLYKTLNYNNLVCFPNIKREEYLNIKDKNTGILATEIIEEGIILFKDDIETIRESGTLIKKLNSMLLYKPKNEVPFEIINKVRQVLDKNIIVKESKCPIVKMLEKKQEQIVKMYPEGNTLLRGNAGSGKSIVLTKRALYLAEKFPESKILFLCFNIALVTHYINNIFTNKQIKVMHYHDLKNDSTTELYDFIFIDEGQDFKKVWYKDIINKLSEKEYSHLFIASDGAQLIYNQDTDYSYSDLGLEFKNVLKLEENYRNTAEICTLADTFLLTDKDIANDMSKPVYDNFYITKTYRKYRNGKMPELNKFENIEDEYKYISAKIQELHNKGVHYSQIGIIIFLNKDIDNIKTYLKDIPICFINNNKYQFNLNNDYVHVSVVNSAKGLEFDYVFLCGFNKIQKHTTTEIKRVYVGMTRAIRELEIVYSEETKSEITEGIEAAYESSKNVIQGELILNKYNQFVEDQFNEIEIKHKLLLKFEEDLKKKESKLQIKETHLKSFELDLVEKDRNLSAPQKMVYTVDHIKKPKRSFFAYIVIVVVAMGLLFSKDILLDVLSSKTSINKLVVANENIISFSTISIGKITNTYATIKVDGEYLIIDGIKAKGYFKHGFSFKLDQVDDTYVLSLSGEYREQPKDSFSNIDTKIELDNENIEFVFSNEAVMVTNGDNEEINISDFTDYKDKKFKTVISLK